MALIANDGVGRPALVVVYPSLSWLLSALAWLVFTSSHPLPVRMAVVAVAELAVVGLRWRALGGCTPGNVTSAGSS